MSRAKPCFDGIFVSAAERLPWSVLLNEKKQTLVQCVDGLLLSVEQRGGEFE